MDKWLRNNTFVRIVAVLIAILLWIVVHMDVQSSNQTVEPGISEQKIYNVKLVPKIDTNQYSIQSIDPTEVSVLIRGKQSALRKVDLDSFRVELDLNGLGAGTHTVTARPVNYPSSVTVEVTPATVQVSIEEKQVKQIPVTISVIGTPAAGYKAGQPIVKPNRVHVTLPSSLLEQVELARGEINIDKASSAVVKQVKLSAYDKNGKEIDGVLNPTVVDVEVPITSPFKTMPLQVKLVGQVPQGYAIASVTQNPETITAYGPQDVLDKMDFYDSGLQVKVDGLTSDKQETLDIPLKAKITQLEPTGVALSIHVVPSVTKTFDNVPFTIVGANDSATTKIVSPQTGTVSVTVEGAQEILDKMKMQDLQAIVDVSNLPPGKHDVPISFNLPTFVKRVTPVDLKASVDIALKSAASPTPAATASGASAPPEQSGQPVQAQPQQEQQKR